MYRFVRRAFFTIGSSLFRGSCVIFVLEKQTSNRKPASLGDMKVRYINITHIWKTMLGRCQCEFINKDYNLFNYLLQCNALWVNNMFTEDTSKLKIQKNATKVCEQKHGKTKALLLLGRKVSALISLFYFQYFPFSWLNPVQFFDGFVTRVLVVSYTSTKA